MPGDPLIYRGVVFDVDGVITRTFQLQADAFECLVENVLEIEGQQYDLKKRFLQKHGYAFSKEAFLNLGSGLAREKQIRLFFELEGEELGAEIVKEIGSQKNIHYQRILAQKIAESPHELIFPETKALIQRLVEKNIPIAFASGSTSAAALLEKVGLLGYFTAGVFPKEGAVTPEGLKTHYVVLPRRASGQQFIAGDFDSKPARAVYASAAEHLGMGLTDVFVIEDSAKVAKTYYKGMSLIYIGSQIREGDSHYAVALCETHAACFQFVNAALNEGRLIQAPLLSAHFVVGGSACQASGSQMAESLPVTPPERVATPR